jgi:hypothetical protein
MKRTAITIATRLVVVALFFVATTAAAVTFEEEPNDAIEDANEVTNADDVEGFRCLPGLTDPDGTQCPGATDSDYFVYTGLDTGSTYDLTLDNTLLGIGWYNANDVLLESVAFVGFPELTDLVPTVEGEIIIRVCGHLSGQSVFDCSASSVGAGPYLLILPEPAPGALALTVVFALAALRSRATPSR